MALTAEFDLKQCVLMNDAFGPREVRQMQDAIAHDFSQYAVLRDAVGELQSREEPTPASQVRLGVCMYLLGRYYRAIEALTQADGGAMALYYQAKCHLARQEYAEAVDDFDAAAQGGLRRRRVRLGQGRGAALRRRSGRGAQNARQSVGCRRADPPSI